MSSHASTIDVTELTIPTFHAALREGQTSITAVVRAYLSRITQHDKTLKSLITINSNALSEAAEKDAETGRLLQQNAENTTPAVAAAAASLPALHGVPILLKDNYTTYGLPTSGGSKALATLSSRDSNVVRTLRQNGAIIIGKANLHEFALHGTTTSSLGGQTLNPYDSTRTPGGSSGGTGAALALNLGMVGCGTDTVNSLRSPASACSIVGFRPSLGRVDTQGIVPVSETQDVAGPMGRCVGDVKVLFDVMKGDSKGSVTESRKSGIEKGVFRIGVLEEYFHLETPSSSSSSSSSSGTLDAELVAENAIVQEVTRNALSLISSAQDPSNINITLVSIPANSHNDNDWSVSHLLDNGDTQAFEFRECLNKFLQSEGVSSPHPSLESIASSGEYDRKAVTNVFTLPLSDKETYSRTSPEYKSRLALIESLKTSVRNLFTKHDLDALVYPHQRHFPIKIGPTVQPARNGILAALTGRPAICIPGKFCNWPPFPGIRGIWC
jgi:Asp-tRNA(Asn)/Glu-tRNA(Gln) amidotransferase A subunit family amidase